MKSVGAILDDAAAAAEAKRQKHRAWHWCRRKNGFSDNPLWRVVAEKLGLQLHAVQAFTNRLEELANQGEPRGFVGDFKAAEFGAALGMPAEDAARIFAALEEPEIGWVDQQHVATFWLRNKDDEPDETAALRSRRSYARRELRTALRRLGGEGRLSRADIDAVLADLPHMSDDELFELERRRRIGQLAVALSTESEPHAPSRSLTRENVRPHTRAEQEHIKGNYTGSVDNSGDTDRGEAVSSAKEEGSGAALPTAGKWLRSEGARIVTERMALFPGAAQTKIERWLREVEFNTDALALMVDAVRQQNVRGDDFEIAVARQIEQRRLDATEQRRLPLVTLPRRQGGAA
jgi:hypothetical protein